MPKPFSRTTGYQGRQQPCSVLIVWKLDRLGRSLCDLITMLDDLKDRPVTAIPTATILHGT